MADERLSRIQAEIDRLEAEKAGLIADPKRQEVRELWEQLASIVDRLDDLGENVQDGSGYAPRGYPPVLRGATFSMNGDGKITETRSGF